MTIAIYHCSIKIISRGKGKSAVAAAAYRSGEKLTNDYDGTTHDFTRKGGVVHTEILLPDNAPREYAERSTLWNAVEDVEKSKNAQLSREIEIALPNELSEAECIELAREFAQKTFVDKGMCADVCIHNPNREQKNIHAHIMLTMRPFNEDGTWGDKQKKEYLLDKNGNKIYDKRKRTYKCSTYAKRKDECSAHFIRTVVLEELVLKELRKITTYVREHEEEFVELAMQNSAQKQSAELKAAKKRLAQSEKRVSELDKLFTRLYEDNVSGKISDERFEMMSKNYEAEQKELRQIVSELTAFVQASEQKNTDTAQFIGIVRKYSEIPKLTPEIMHEFIEKIVVYAPDKSSGHRTQQIDICFRFNVMTATVTADSVVYDKKRKAA